MDFPTNESGKYSPLDTLCREGTRLSVASMSVPGIRRSHVREDAWFCLLRSEAGIYIYLPYKKYPTKESALEAMKTYSMLLEAGGYPEEK